MPATFTRTLRSLEADGARRHLALIALAALLLLGWLAWFFLGDVAVYELTDTARIEVKTAAHPVAARLDGQIVTTRLEIGREVKEGEVLVELDATAEELALEQGRARSADLRARLVALRAEIVAEEDSAKAHFRAAEISTEESKARVKEAEAHAEFAERQAEVAESLREDGTGSEEALRQARADASASRAAVEALRMGAARAEQALAVEQADRRTRLAKLHREAVELEGLITIEDASNRKLEREIELRRIRAPVDGRIGEARDLRVGSVVVTGEKLGAVVPPGEPRAVAYFPVSGVGRIRPGQPARLRMDGFPWTRYGILAASVSDLASEPTAERGVGSGSPGAEWGSGGRGGRVRVELALGDNRGTEIPIEHGITGSAEIEVERTSPAKLVLRAAGEMLRTKPEPSAEGRMGGRGR